MTSAHGREIGAYKNALNQSIGKLVGIAQGILADKKLDDGEVAFLRDWLENNAVVATAFPGNVIFERVKSVLSDGIITEEERSHLLRTTQDIVGGTIEELDASTHVINLGFDEVGPIAFMDAAFCLTGEFVLGPKSACEKFITDRGGRISKTVSKKIRYVVAGGRGSDEWKHGSFGRKIERAIELQREGTSILLVHEKRLILAGAQAPS